MTVPPIALKRVAIESPYASNVKRNLKYLRHCIYDSINRGEAPFASHGFYTMFLDDDDEIERNVGIVSGLAWSQTADTRAFYTDHGWSPGMIRALTYYRGQGLSYELRAITGAVQQPPQMETADGTHR